MNTGTDRGRSVFRRLSKRSLSLVLGAATAAAAVLCPLPVFALETHTPITAVPVTAVPVTDRTPLVATPVEQTEAAETETDTASAYVNEYLGFTRTELVSYLVSHAGTYLETPSTFANMSPTPGKDGNLQCEGFIWSVMYQVATKNQEDVPCGSVSTAPVGNGGGWVNWAYYHDIEPLTFATKEEMLASGKLEKGDVIWSFDTAGPYGLSNANHVGFFWGDNASDDKFWQSGLNNDTELYAGRPDGNQITPIGSAAASPSVWWVFKLSDDESWDPANWAGLPTLNGVTAETQKDTASEPQSDSYAETVTTVHVDEEERDTGIVSSSDMGTSLPKDSDQEIVFYGG